MTVDKKKAVDIIKQLCDNGWQAYIVGGAARDILNGDIPQDYDIVTNASYDAIQKCFQGRRFKIVGSTFRVCMIDGIEVSTFRSVNGPFADRLKEDLSKRDLTINAMAYNPYTGEVVDYFGGKKDLETKWIRLTASPLDRLAEDPCRMIRACRFLSKIKGKFDPVTLKVIQDNGRRLYHLIAPERIRLEILKAMQNDRPGLFFDGLYQAGLLELVFPGMTACVNLDGGKYHAETVYEHQIIVGDVLPKNRPLLRLAGYLHDIGKPLEAEHKDGHISFISHEKTGAKKVARLLNDYRFSQDEIVYITALVRLHMRQITPDTRPKTIRKHLKAFVDAGISWKDWLRIKIADRTGNLKKANYSRHDIKAIVLAIHFAMAPQQGNAALTVGGLAVNGNDIIRALNIQEGRVVGRLLRMALDHVLDDPTENTYDALLDFVGQVYEQKKESL